MKKNIFFVVALVVIVISCIKMPQTPGPINSLNIPAGFDWKTVRELNVNVGVGATFAQSSNKVHLIRIYSSPLMNSGSLLSSGVAVSGSPYNVKLSVATPLSHLYIHETRPDGTAGVTTLAVNSENLNITLNQSSAAALPLLVKSGVYQENTSFPAPSISTPAVYDEVLNNNSPQNIYGYLVGEANLTGNAFKSYLIPEGRNRNGNLSFNNYRTHALLFVRGRLTLDATDLNRCSIVVLPGGEVVVNQELKTSFFTESIPALFVHTGGTLTLKGAVSLSGGTSLVNKGTITITGSGGVSFNMSTSESFYNEGTFLVNNSNMSLILNNTSRVYNSGTFNAPDIKLNNSSIYFNDIGAVTTSGKWYQTNTSQCNNSGEIVVTNTLSTSGGGIINNNCKITANICSLQGSTVNLESGSLMMCQSNSFNNCVINMISGSMLLTSNVTTVYGLTVNGGTVGYSLFKNTGLMPVLQYAATSFTGKVEYVHTNLTETPGDHSRSNYSGSFVGDAILSKNQSKNIPGTGCNMNLGQTDPGGGGGPDPLFGVFFPSESGWATYAFEDMWPKKGDYDLNDLVMEFRVSFYANSSNLITELHFDYNIKACGATYNLASAFMLDNVNASNIESVSGQVIGGSNPFAKAVNGTESGVSKAVVPLFNNTKSIVDYTGFLNTERETPFIACENKKVIVKFIAPVDQASLNMSSFNFFITVNERGREVHLPGFSATERFNPLLAAGSTLHPSDNFKFADGMMWGLMFPVSFDYPVERASIINAYTYFAAWATSGGVSYPDWYSNKPGYRDDRLIY